MEYIIRDHSFDEFEGARWRCGVLSIFCKEGEGSIRLTLKDQYFNMSKMVAPHPELIQYAREAMLSLV